MKVVFLILFWNSKLLGSNCWTVCVLGPLGSGPAHSCPLLWTFLTGKLDRRSLGNFRAPCGQHCTESPGMFPSPALLVQRGSQSRVIRCRRVCLLPVGCRLPHPGAGTAPGGLFQDTLLVLSPVTPQLWRQCSLLFRSLWRWVGCPGTAAVDALPHMPSAWLRSQAAVAWSELRTPWERAPLAAGATRQPAVVVGCCWWLLMPRGSLQPVGWGVNG